MVIRAVINIVKVDIVTTSDTLIDLNYIVYMFQRDSIHGKFKVRVKVENQKLVINGKPISFFQEQDCANIKCGDAGAGYVVESPDVFTNIEKREPRGSSTLPLLRTTPCSSWV